MEVQLDGFDLLTAARSLAAWLAAHSGVVQSLRLELSDKVGRENGWTTPCLSEAQVGELFEALAGSLRAACAHGALLRLELELHLERLDLDRLPAFALPPSMVAALAGLTHLKLEAYESTIAIEHPLAALTQLRELDFKSQAPGLAASAALPASLTALTLDGHSLPRQVRVAGWRMQRVLRTCCAARSMACSSALRQARSACRWVRPMQNSRALPALSAAGAADRAATAVHPSHCP